MYQKHHQNKPSEHPHLQETLPPGLGVPLKERTRPAACDSALGSWGWETPAQFIMSSFEALSDAYEASTEEVWLEAM